MDYEDLSPEQVRLDGEMLEYPFLSGADAWLAQGVFKMWLTSSLIRQVVYRGPVQESDGQATRLLRSWSN